MLVMLGDMPTLATSIVDSAVALPPSSSLTVKAIVAAVVVRGEAPRGGRADGEGRRRAVLGDAPLVGDRIGGARVGHRAAEADRGPLRARRPAPVIAAVGATLLTTTVVE